VQAHRSLPPQKGQSNTCDTFGFAFLGGGLARFRLPLRQGCGRGQGLEAGGDAGGTHIAASGGEALQRTLSIFLAARAQPATAARHRGHTDPTTYLHLTNQATDPTPPHPLALLSRTQRGRRSVLGTHVVLPCQADPTFAAYPYSPRALRAAHRS
jgi:hypothetical protein